MMHLLRSRRLLYAVAFALPIPLLYSSLRTFRALDAQREVYLRQLAATVAGQMETAADRNEPEQTTFLSLAASEPHLRNLRVFSDPGPGSEASPLNAVWKGNALFHTELIEENGAPLYRAYVPLHRAGRLNVAQIDLDATAADFLLEHARNNVTIALAEGLVLALLSLYAIWAAGRTAALERRQLELQHLAHLGTMSAVLAHEIRNPLGTIKGFAQLALEKAGAEVEPLLTPVLQQSRRLESLVSDLLVYGRPPSPDLRPVQWADVAAGLEAQAARLVAGRPVRVVIDQQDTVFVTDRNLLEHILMNLIRNAIDAVAGTPAAVVEVVASLDTNPIEFSVRDNGPGIPEADREKVLDPFYTTKSLGTGLGLPISARLSKALDGALELRAAAPRGILATVRLPRRN